MPLFVWVLVLILHSSKAARLICDTESKSHFGGLAGLADLCPECQWPGLECFGSVRFGLSFATHRAGSFHPLSSSAYTVGAVLA